MLFTSGAVATAAELAWQGLTLSSTLPVKEYLPHSDLRRRETQFNRGRAVHYQTRLMAVVEDATISHAPSNLLSRGPLMKADARVQKTAKRSKRRRRMVAAIVVLFHVLGVVSSINAVMTARTAQGAIAWGVSLITFPYIAVPAYWVLGRRNFEGYQKAWIDRHDEVKQFEATMRERLEPFAVETLERIPNYEAMKRLAHSPLLRGNDATLLVDGDATFDSIFEGLVQAEHYALVQFYIIRDDGLGRRLKSALIDCANRGVKVFVLYDEVGSLGVPKSYLAELEAAGIQQSEFNTTQGAHNRFQLNFRNHRKNVVIDGKVTWIGGHNVGDEYLGLDPKVGHWRDTHVRIEGPAAQVAQAMFLGDWYWAKRTIPDLDWEPEAASTGADVMAMVLPIAPIDTIETAQLFFVHALNAARDRIWIATPYFVPDQAVMAALRLAALRGVDVRIIVPEKGDNPGRPGGALVRQRAVRCGPDLPALHRRLSAPEGAAGRMTMCRRSAAPTSTTGLSGCSSRSTPSSSTKNSGSSSRRCSKTTWRTRRRGTDDLRDASFIQRLSVSVARLTAPLL